MTTTATTTLGKLTPHQRDIAMNVLRKLRPPTNPHADYLPSDVFVVARTKRTVRHPESTSVRRHLGCIVYEVGSAGALHHLDRKGYLQGHSEGTLDVEQTFYAATPAGLEWYAAQLARAERAAAQDDRIRAAATYSEGSDI